MGSTNETFNQSYSNDFDSSEAPTFLGCFKHPVPRNQEASNNHMHSCSPAGRLESHQRSFGIETLLLCPGDLLSKSSKLTFSRKRWCGGQPPVNVRRVGGKHNTVKQADSGFGGWIIRKFQGELLKPDHALVFCQASFLMTFAMGGIPHAGSWHHHSPRQHPNTQRSCPHQPMEILPGSPSLLPF